jgi:hypothetical protein
MNSGDEYREENISPASEVTFTVPRRRVATGSSSVLVAQIETVLGYGLWIVNVDENVDELF